MLGLAMAARCEGAMEGEDMRFSAQRADASITFMPKVPAAITLGDASLMFGRREDETMTAIHKGGAHKVLKVETCTGVCNIKSDRAGVRVACILGELGQEVLIVTEVLGERRGIEDLGDLVHHEGDQFASLLLVFGRQTVVGEVAYFEECKLRLGLVASRGRGCWFLFGSLKSLRDGGECHNSRSRDQPGQR